MVLRSWLHLQIGQFYCERINLSLVVVVRLAVSVWQTFGKVSDA
jgi:hypothetical protein